MILFLRISWLQTFQREIADTIHNRCEETVKSVNKKYLSYELLLRCTLSTPCHKASFILFSVLNPEWRKNMSVSAIGIIKLIFSSALQEKYKAN